MTYHYSKFLGLMESYNIKQDAQVKALNSTNSAMQENEKYLNSIEGKYNQFKTTLEELYKTAISSDFLITIVKTGTGALNVLQNLINGFGGLNTSILLATTAMGVFYAGAIKTFITGFTSIGALVRGLGAAIVSLFTNPVTIALVAVTALVGGLAYYYNAQETARKQTIATNESIKTITKSIDEFNKTLDPKNISDATQELEKMKQAMDFEGKEKRVAELTEKIKQLKVEAINAQKEFEESQGVLSGNIFKRIYSASKGTVVDYNTEKSQEELKKLEAELKKVYETQEKVNKQQEIATAIDYEAIQSNTRKVALKLTEANQNVALIESYKSVYEKMKQGIKLTEEESNLNERLLQQYPEQRKLINEKTNAIGVNYDALNDNLSIQKVLAVSEFELAKLTAKTQAEKTNNLIDETKKRITAMNEELKAQQRLLEYYSKPKEQIIKYTDEDGKEQSVTIPGISSGDVGSGFAAETNLTKKIQDINQTIVDETNKLEKLKTGYNYEMQLAESDLNKVLSLGSSKKTSDYFTGGKGTGGTTTGSAEIEAPEKLIEKERYQQLNQELTKYNNLIADNKALQETADYKTKIDLMEKESDLLVQKQNILHRLADEKRKERAEAVSSLSNKGIQFTGVGDDITSINATTVLNKQIEEINSHRLDKDKKVYNQLKETHEETKSYLETFNSLKDEIPKLGQEYIGLSKNINELKIEELNIGFKGQEKQIKSLKDNLSVLKDEYDGLAETDFGSKFKNTIEQIISTKNLNQIAIDQINKFKQDLVTATTDAEKELIQQQIDSLTSDQSGYNKDLYNLGKQRAELLIEPFNKQLEELDNKMLLLGEDDKSGALKLTIDKQTLRENLEKTVKDEVDKYNQKAKSEGLGTAEYGTLNVLTSALPTTALSTSKGKKEVEKARKEVSDYEQELIRKTNEEIANAQKQVAESQLDFISKNAEAFSNATDKIAFELKQLQSDYNMLDEEDVAGKTENLTKQYNKQAETLRLLNLKIKENQDLITNGKDSLGRELTEESRKQIEKNTQSLKENALTVKETMFGITKSVKAIDLDSFNKSIEKLFETSNESVKILNNSMEDLNYQFSMLDNEDYTRKNEILTEKNNLLAESIQNDQRELDKLNNITNLAILKDENYKTKKDEVNKRIRDNTLLLKDNNNTIKENSKTLEENAKKLIQTAIETEKALAERPLIEKEDKLKEESRRKDLEFYKAELKQKQDILDLEKNIYGTTQEVYEANIKLKVDALQQQLDILNQQNDIQKEQEERAKKLLEIEKQRNLISNLEKERNVRLFTGGKFQWVSDPTKLREEREKLSELELGLAESDSEKALSINRKEIEDKIKAYNDETESRKSNLDKQKSMIESVSSKEKEKWELSKKEREIALEEERISFDAQYKDIDVKVANGLEQLKLTMGTKWDEIIAVLTDRVGKAEVLNQRAMGYTNPQPTTVSKMSESQFNANVTGYMKTHSNIANDINEYNAKNPNNLALTVYDYYNKAGYNKDIQKFDTGGATGNNEGLAYLHKKELVLKPDDTKNFLESVKLNNIMLNGLKGNGLNLTKINNRNENTSGVVNNYNINVEEVKTNDATAFIQNMRNYVMKR